jgi:ADP-ribosylglycohydrolase
VLTAVELAFSALANAASFEEGVSAAVGQGGDAEANGAVAGALLGAKFGKAQVPERWVKQSKAATELASLGETLSK